ncbi:hypothetical protein TNCV_4429871 [Trichonephila clavipes]|nr:hypothetical protein TNCV_4429871 [Trichonephila clavipes]
MTRSTLELAPPHSPISTLRGRYKLKSKPDYTPYLLPRKNSRIEWADARKICRDGSPSIEVLWIFGEGDISSSVILITSSKFKIERPVTNSRTKRHPRDASSVFTMDSEHRKKIRDRTGSFGNIVIINSDKNNLLMGNYFGIYDFSIQVKQAEANINNPISGSQLRYRPSHSIMVQNYEVQLQKSLYSF